MGEVIGIAYREKPRAPMQNVAQSEITVEAGLAGDCRGTMRGRQVTVLTEEGWRVLKSADPLSRKVDERILAALPPGQRDRFLQDLNAIVQALGRMQPKEVATKSR